MLSLLFQCGDARQRTPFHPFEKRSAGGRNEAELAGDAGVVERGDRVASTRDRDQRAFLGQRGRRLRQCNGRFVERRRFEGA